MSNIIEIDSKDVQVKRITRILTECDNNIIFDALCALPLFDVLSISAMTDVIIKDVQRQF